MDDFDPFASPFNDCANCGVNMGRGGCGLDKDSDEAICLDCWSVQHPQGMAPHSSLDFYMLPVSAQRGQG